MTSSQLAAVFAAKKLLRKELKKKLKSLTNTQKHEESAIINNKIICHTKYKESKNICVYVAMEEEVDTERLIANILESKKNLFVPFFNKDEMFMVKINDMEDYSSLPYDTYGVRQPVDYLQRAQAIETTGLDLILCPGLGFTKQGLRIGRGKGYYDNYITKYESIRNSAPYTIALAFSIQMLDDVPTTGADRQLDEVISV